VTSLSDLYVCHYILVKKTTTVRLAIVRREHFRFVRSVAEHLPNSRDVFLDDLGVDVGIGPHRLENLGLGHKPSGILDQVTEYIESFGSERDTGIRTP